MYIHTYYDTYNIYIHNHNYDASSSELTVIKPYIRPLLAQSHCLLLTGSQGNVIIPIL